MAKKILMKKKKINKNVSHGRMYIQATFNNTIITITDDKGNCISWSSAGSLGFKGTRKSTPYAAQLAAQAAVEKAKISNLQSIEIYVTGVGQGRESAIRSLSTAGLVVTSIKDTTPIPHNGCRPKKIRRV